MSRPRYPCGTSKVDALDFHVDDDVRMDFASLKGS
jgi:hypothetical protein